MYPEFKRCDVYYIRPIARGQPKSYKRETVFDYLKKYYSKLAVHREKRGKTPCMCGLWNQKPCHWFKESEYPIRCKRMAYDVESSDDESTDEDVGDSEDADSTSESSSSDSSDDDISFTSCANTSDWL